jgi:hypothetical protein
VRQGITSLDALATDLQPLLAFATPAQSVCNYGSLLFRNVGSSVSLQGVENATFQRFIVLGPPEGPQSELGPSSKPASGGDDVGVNFLHYNPYPNTAAPGQVRECEAGNEDYIQGSVVIGNEPGNQGTNTQEQIIAKDLSPKKKKKKKKGKK